MTLPPVHPIEEASYRIMASEVDFSSWPPGARQVVMRMVHATADESFAAGTLIGERAVEAAVTALRGDALVICDSNMVAAGVPTVAARLEVKCYLSKVPSEETPGGETRSARAVALAAAEHPEGALWVFGNAPSALLRLLELHRIGRLAPAAVIALPVGYVGAAEAKRTLWESPLRPITVTNTGRRGGSPAAAGALNALARLAWAQPPPR